MRLFAYSDHHYGHQNIIKYCHRKTEDILNENLTALDDAKAMIEAHNNTVEDDDYVIFAGDIQASKQGRDWVKKIIPKLKGKKILVRGNHDHLTNQEYLDMGFEQVHEVLVIGPYCFCHYPDKASVVALCKEHNFVLCCGHTHKPFRDYGDGVRRVNLAIDVIGREPLHIADYVDDKLIPVA